MDGQEPDEENRMYTCDDCGENIQGATATRRHYDEEHPVPSKKTKTAGRGPKPEKPKYECSYCLKKMSEKGSIPRHAARRHAHMLYNHKDGTFTPRHDGQATQPYGGYKAQPSQSSPGPSPGKQPTCRAELLHPPAPANTPSHAVERPSSGQQRGSNTGPADQPQPPTTSGSPANGSKYGQPSTQYTNSSYNNSAANTSWPGSYDQQRGSNAGPTDHPSTPSCSTANPSCSPANASKYGQHSSHYNTSANNSWPMPNQGPCDYGQSQWPAQSFGQSFQHQHQQPAGQQLPYPQQQAAWGQPQHVRAPSPGHVGPTVAPAVLAPQTVVSNALQGHRQELERAQASVRYHQAKVLALEAALEGLQEADNDKDSRADSMD